MWAEGVVELTLVDAWQLYGFRNAIARGAALFSRLIGQQIMQV